MSEEPKKFVAGCFMTVVMVGVFIAVRETGTGSSGTSTRSAPTATRIVAPPIGNIVEVRLVNTGGGTSPQSGSVELGSWSSGFLGNSTAPRSGTAGGHREG
jgi:hypothetical protein